MSEFSDDEWRRGKAVVGFLSMALMVTGSIAIEFFTDAPNWAKWAVSIAWGLYFAVSLAAWGPDDD
jgi:hypothetical protein